MEQGGECEGDYECRFNENLQPLLDFLGRFPKTEFTARAIDEVKGMLSDILRDLPRAVDSADVPQAARTVLSTFDVRTSKLTPEVRGALASTVDSLRLYFGLTPTRQ